ncbi:MAG: HAMP domain-containing histidine kinase [Deltaproteobacteria bacterium]|nr:MAG: HAMP domain-containing histidine kinase [Deltaproteobacteria bacterium]
MFGGAAAILLRILPGYCAASRALGEVQSTQSQHSARTTLADPYVQEYGSSFNIGKELKCIVNLHARLLRTNGAFDKIFVYQDNETDGRNYKVRVDSGPAGPTVAVHNRGASIAPQLLPRLFQRLQRGEHGAPSAARSVGLGLYIVNGWFGRTLGGSRCAPRHLWAPPLPCTCRGAPRAQPG